jgi:hypothetical protein
VSPGVPAHVAASPGPTAGSWRLSFQAPPAEVAENGYGGTTWVEWVPQPALQRGTHLFRLQDMVGSGTVYADVFNGLTDLASQQLQLSSAPQTLSLLVELPSFPATNPPPRVQVRTYSFPLDVTVTPVIQSVSPDVGDGAPGDPGSPFARRRSPVPRAGGGWAAPSRA